MSHPKTTPLHQPRLNHTTKREPIDIGAAIRQMRWRARAMYYRLPFIELEEFESVGLVTLNDALLKFDPARSSFRSYFRMRLRWAMASAVVKRLKRFDPTRGVPLGVAMRSTQHRATKIHVASLSEEFFIPSLLENRGKKLPGVMTPAGDLAEKALDPSETPEQKAVRKELDQVLDHVLEQLPKWERTVLTLHYFAGERFVTIARLLNMKKSKVSRLHRKALTRCAAILKQQNLDFDVLVVAR